MSKNETPQSKKQMNKLVAVAVATAVSLGTVVNMETAAFATTEPPVDPTAVDQTAPLLGATISPSVPTGLTVAAGNGIITANWVANVDGTDSYNVQYSTSSTFTTATTVTVNSTDNTEVISGLKPLTTYYVKVAGVSAGVVGTYSTAVTAKTFGVPSAPSSLKLTVGVKTLNATWVAPTTINGSAVTKYVIQYSTDSTFATGVTTVESPDAVEALTGLNDATKYYVRVASVNAVGQGAFGAAVSATTAALPTAAQTVAATSAAGSSTVAWKAPTSNGGVALTGYRVEYSKDASFITVAGSVTVAGTVLTTVVKPLDPSTTYYYRVIAINALGEAPSSNVATATSFPVATAPATLTATPGVASSVVKWTAPTSNGGSPVTGYKVEYSTNADFTGSKTVTTSATTVSTTLTGLTAGATYYVRVAATTLAGTGAFATAPAVKIFAAPSSPNAFTVTGGNLSFVAKWTAPTDNGGSAITGYTVTYSTDSTFATGVKTVAVASTALTTTVTGLTAGTTYYVKVTAKNAAGTSAPATTVNVSTNKAPDAPATVTLKTAVGTTGPTVTPTWTASPNLYGQVLTNYSVQYSTDASFAPANTKTVLTKSLTTAISGVQSNTTYYVRVATLTAAGTGAYTAPVSITTPASANIPVGVTVTVPAAKTVVVDVPVVAGVTKTTVQASLASTFTSPITVTAVNGKATFTGLAEGKVYYFRAQDTNSVGASAYNATVTATTLAAPVTNVNTTNVGVNSATLNWTASASTVTGYNIYKNDVLVGTVASGVLSYNVSGLNESTAYVLSVSAVNVSGESAKVNTSVTTLASLPVSVTNITSSNVTANSVTLAWTPGVGGGAVVSYNVYNNGILIGNVPANAPTYTVSGLLDGTKYVFSIEAVNASGVSPKTDITVNTVDVIAPVSNLVGVAKFDANGDQYAQISWSANAEASTYEIYKNDVLVATNSSNATSYNTSLNVAEQATFSIVAVKADGVTKSVASSVTVTAAAVYPVANVHAVNVGQHSANIAWDAQAMAVSYDVYANGVKVGNTSSASYNFTTLNTNTTNTVSVVAVYANGVSKPVALDVKTLGNLAPAVSVTNAVPDAASLEWDSATGVQSYQVINGAGAVVSTIDVAGQAPRHIKYDVKNLQANTSYNYSVKAVMIDGENSSNVTVKTSALSSINLHVVSNGYTSADIGWTEAPGASGYRVTGWGLDVTLPAGTTSYTVTGLTPGGFMTSYTVAPIYSFGEGLAGTVNLTGKGLPNPQDWAGSATLSTSATLTWSEPAVSGIVLKAHDVFLDGMYVATVPAGTTSYTFTGLKANTSYFMSVNSVYDIGTSYQAGVSVKTPLYDAYPVASVDTYAVSSTSVNVGWKRIFDSNLVSYTIKMNGVKLIDIDPTSSFYVVNGLTANTTYNFTVTANYTYGSSAPVSSSVTTFPTAPTVAALTAGLPLAPGSVSLNRDVWSTFNHALVIEENGANDPAQGWYPNNYAYTPGFIDQAAWAGVTDVASLLALQSTHAGAGVTFTAPDPYRIVKVFPDGKVQTAYNVTASGQIIPWY